MWQESPIGDLTLDITSISGHFPSARFSWKICQTVAGIKNHPSLSHLIFGGFLPFGPTVRSDKWAGLLYALITTSRTISHECVVAA